MMKFIKNKLKEEKGLTLIELLAVIVILGIIAAIAIPAIGNIIENSRYGAAKADMQNALAAANLYVSERGSDPATLADIEDFLDNPGTLRTGTTFERIDDVMNIDATLEIQGEDGTITTGNYTNQTLSGLSNGEFKDQIQP